MDAKQLKNILEAGLLVAGKAMSLAQLENLFAHDNEKPDRKSIKQALEELKQEYDGRGIELVEIASGYRLQSNESVKDYVANLFQEKAPRYSRALLETLVLIAYRQPITRAEIEEVRGVAVSSNIIKTLQEREWVKVLGHKDVPGKPALLGTTKEFLDYFNLKKLDDLPSLAEIKDLDQFEELLAEDAANDSGVDVELGGDVDSEVQEANDASSNDSETGGDDADMPDAESASLSDIDLGDVQEEHEASDSQQVADSDQDNENDDDSDQHNSTLSGPEEQLIQTLSNFADEHQLEVDARDQMEANMLSSRSNAGEDDANEESVADASSAISSLDANSDANADDELDDIDIADLSQHTEDLKTGDLPEPGDTLH